MPSPSSFPSPPKPPEWASHVEGRNPAFRMHTAIGPAKNSVINSGNRGGIVYHFEHGEWVPVWNYLLDRTCIVCGEEVETHPGYLRTVNLTASAEERRLIHYDGWKHGLTYEEQGGPCWRTYEAERKRIRQEKIAQAQAAQNGEFDD